MDTKMILKGRRMRIGQRLTIQVPVEVVAGSPQGAVVIPISGEHRVATTWSKETDQDGDS